VFDDETYAYTATTINYSDIISVDTAEEGINVVITVNGDIIDNGDAVVWEDGENTVTINTYAGLITEEHVVTVTKVDATLSALEIGTLELTPAFNGYTFEYAVETENATDTITATSANVGAVVAIELNEVAHTSGDAATWLAGENTVEITVTVGSLVNTYTIIVTKI
jgi:hypothetical protein